MYPFNPLFFDVFKLCIKSDELKIRLLKIHLFKGSMRGQKMERGCLDLLKNIPAPIIFCNEKGEIEIASQTLTNILGKVFEGEKNLKNIFPSWDIKKASQFFANLEGYEVQVNYSPFVQNNVLKGGIFFFSFLKETEKAFPLIQKDKSEIINFILKGLAHDFRNFLFAVQGQLELAHMAKSPQEKNNHLAKAFKALSRAREFAENIMKDVHQQKFDLHETLQEVLESLLANKNIKWTLYIPENVWMPKIDKIHLVQIFINLVKNSLEAMPAGGQIVLEAENIYLSTKKGKLNPGPYVKFVLIDNGKGIGPSELPLVFIPYFSSKDKIRGLGLSMVRAIVWSNGGDIYLESKPQEGTKVEVFLPATLKENAIESFPGEREKGPEISIYVAAKKRILLLEDEPEIGSFLKESLEFMNYKVIWVKTPDEAFRSYKEALAKNNPFDLVISDYHLPQVNGLEFLVTLKELHPRAKVLIITEERSQELKKSLERAGAIKVLTKPFSIEDLGRVLAETFNC
ncbi:ATP-binding protein [Thermodesulfatator autotrophicus]|uniref:histidine kinase n=1 Tax=Thermodesulfatator autotrophicus TaxID=1795632 RepID=A0A177E401_9BACT|nr:ATP-binding protein [Thermodesulfatator autotrophicus]OAG26687.1 hypothetical protein TH606_11005 [Thermodesulfatator autotrophicus]